MDVLLVVQIIIVVALIATILLQRSSADGFTGGGSSADSLFSSRGKANALTRATAILATAFIVNSLILAYMSSHAEQNSSIIDSVQVEDKKIDPEDSSSGDGITEAEPVVPLAD